MDLRRRLKYSQYWNIGFCVQTPEELIRNKKLKKIKWLKHPYHDRWFADPFIYRITKDEIIVFVEECLVSDNPKGIICELVIDRNSMRLKGRYVLLELDTHLSYPAILNVEGIIYVYPENGASGKLNIYEYDSINHKLVNPVCILKEAVADASILKRDNQYYLSATKFPHTQECAYLYKSDSIFGPFKQVCAEPYQMDRSCSRQGGDWFLLENELYRPAQNCRIRYGSSLNIMTVNIENGVIKEKPLFAIKPCCSRYSEGLHTINFKDGLCVIDSYGYLFGIMKYVYNAGRAIKGFFKKKM